MREISKGKLILVIKKEIAGASKMRTAAMTTGTIGLAGTTVAYHSRTR